MIPAEIDLVPLTQIVGAIGAGIALIAFIFLVAAPAWGSYGRVWEKISALVLSLYVLVAMLGLGALVGVGFFALFGQRI